MKKTRIERNVEIDAVTENQFENRLQNLKKKISKTFLRC